MKKFISDTRGSSTLLSAFMVLALCLIAVVVYSVMMVYTNYQTAHAELERAAIITVDENMLNPNVRDLELDIPKTALEDIEDNLISSGLYQKSESIWEKTSGEKSIYELKDITVSVYDRCLDVSGKFVMPLRWSFGEYSEIIIPITIRARVLYLD